MDTYIIAEVLPRASWGAGCRGFDPGEVCQIKYSGAYSVPAGKAVIDLEAWVPHSDKPYKVERHTLPADRGDFRRVVLEVTVPKVEAMLFRVSLFNEQGAALGSSDSFVYWTDCDGSESS